MIRRMGSNMLALLLTHDSAYIFHPAILAQEGNLRSLYVLNKVIAANCIRTVYDCLDMFAGFWYA